MPTYVAFAVALVVIGLVAWSLAAHRHRRQSRKGALAQLGFEPCPDRKGWLEDTVARIENNRAYRYEVREPKRLRGDPDVYFYVKVRHRHPHEDAMVEEEVLFPLKRPSAAGLFLTMKPTALPPGLATRALSAIATGPWDAQPDDLQRLELPPALKDSNLLAALGPPGARLHDLIDAGTLSLAQGLGDAGGTFVRFRDAWCAVAGASAQVPFRVDAIAARIRPALRGEPGMP